MGIRSWLAQKISPDQEGGRVTQFPPWKSSFPSFREWSTEKAINEGLKESVWIYTCVRKISEAVSSIPWYVQERSGDEWERDENHPVEKLLRNPNPNPLITGTNLLKLEVNHRHLGGNAIWHKNIQGGAPVELWPIKPDRIHPRANQDGTIQDYEYRPEGSAERIILPLEEIIHFQFVNPSDFLWGMSPLQAAARVIDTDTEAIKHNKKILENSAVSSGILSYEHDLKREQWERAKERVAEQAQDPGQPWVLGNSVKWDALTMSAEDLQILQQRQFSMYEIHAAFDVDPLLTGAPDTGGRQNKTEAKREFWQDNIIPYMESLKEGLENNLLVHWDNSYSTSEGEHQLRLEYDIGDIPALREDYTEKVENAQRLYNMGIPVNQINERLELGFEDIPGGDTPQQMQMAGNEPSQTKYDEAFKEMRWKDIEEDRLEWEDRVVEDIEEMFADEAEVVVEAIESTTDVEAVTDAIAGRVDNWQVLIEAMMIPAIEYFGTEELERILEKGKSVGPGSIKDFDAYNIRMQNWLEEHTVEQAKLVTETSRAKITKLFQEAQREGWGQDKIGREIRNTYGVWTEEAPGREIYRAKRIARTEMQIAQGRAGHESALQAEEEYGFKMEKEWLATRDDRTRDIHLDMDGENQNLRDSYSNGLMHPGDPSGPPGDVINCRCVDVHEVVDNE